MNLNEILNVCFAILSKECVFINRRHANAMDLRNVKSSALFT